MNHERLLTEEGVLDGIPIVRSGRDVGSRRARTPFFAQEWPRLSVLLSHRVTEEVNHSYLVQNKLWHLELWKSKRDSPSYITKESEKITDYLFSNKGGSKGERERENVAVGQKPWQRSERSGQPQKEVEWQHNVPFLEERTPCRTVCLQTSCEELACSSPGLRVHGSSRGRLLFIRSESSIVHLGQKPSQVSREYTARVNCQWQHQCPHSASGIKWTKATAKPLCGFQHLLKNSNQIKATHRRGGKPPTLAKRYLWLKLSLTFLLDLHGNWDTFPKWQDFTES